MDFPKSVPGVGLVGDRFVDEDPAIGRQGSLIPSIWGNAVTLELLNVIQAAGLDPSEAQTDQLLEAIRALVPERSAFARITGTQALPASAFGIYALADGGAAATVTLPSTADLVDDTELLLFANHANSAAVQIKAATGETVQGPAALMGASTTAFMLPAGGDWVRLRSEKVQGRWAVVAHWAETRVKALEDIYGQLAATDTATLTSTDNKIVFPSIKSRIKLEKGDVVQVIAEAIGYDKLHTAESLLNSNEIHVNAEHAGSRGNGPLKLPDYTGLVKIKRVTKWFNAQPGVGQEWVDMASFRTVGASYANNTGRTIHIFYSAGTGANGASSSIYVNNGPMLDVGWGGSSPGSMRMNTFLPVLPGADFGITNVSRTAAKWELR